MRMILDPYAERCRIVAGPGRSPRCAPFGAFLLAHPDGGTLCVVMSQGEGWDHVSVSCDDRCPTWDEMCWVKNLFFRPDECVMQLHPPEADYVNFHQYCLHLWRPQKGEIPRPPKRLVGAPES